METGERTEFDRKRRAMLDVNVAQARLYDEIAAQKAAANTRVGGVTASRSRGNVAFRLWATIKRRRRLVQEMVGLDNLNDELHRRWVDPVEGKRVLERGCNVGHDNTFLFADRAESYLGVDLSPTAIESFNAGLRRRGLNRARGIAADFLAPDFPASEFDLVLARNVVHHFRHLEVFLGILHARMAPGGVVLTCDPLQSALSARLVRALYRPFQSDRDWEWPLTARSFATIERFFEVERVQGFLGKSKWAVPISMFSRELAREKGHAWHAHDMERASSIGPGLWPCLFVVMKLRRRELEARTEGGTGARPDALASTQVERATPSVVRAAG